MMDNSGNLRALTAEDLDRLLGDQRRRTGASDAAELTAALDRVLELERVEGTVLVYGDEQAVADIAARTRLGAAELEHRRARRKAQRAARRRNR